VTLKPRIATPVALIFGGAFIAYIAFVSAYLIGWYLGLIPAIVGVLAVAWIAVGITTLIRRQSLAIVIDSSGITIPTGSLFRPREPVHIPSGAIATIARDESVRGRLISVALRTGGNVPIQARHYCELKRFLAHCKSHGLPTA
jgi:hypothetical protein